MKSAKNFPCSVLCFVCERPCRTRARKLIYFHFRLFTIMHTKQDASPCFKPFWNSVLDPHVGEWLIYLFVKRVGNGEFRHPSDTHAWESEKNGKENFLGDNGRMEIVCESFQVRKRFSNSFAASEKFQRLQANRSANISHFLQLFVMEIPQPHFLFLRRMNHSLNGTVA